MDALAKFRGPIGLEHGREALDAMAARAIPTSPANYEVWISYLLGLKPELNQEIDRKFAATGVFDDATNEELHERFFAQTRLTLEMVEAGEGIARELTDVVSSLRGAGEHTKAYVSTLEHAATNFERGVDAHGMRTILSSLAAATRQMAEHNVSLLQQMESSSRQVETLQVTLQNVKVEALTDSLTGLANRKCFDETLNRRLKEARAGDQRLWLMLCDIDHFKRFNDTWGHLTGDQVLRFIGAILQGHARGDFLAARYGGEEFAMILPRISREEALSVCAGVQSAVRGKQLMRRSTSEKLGGVTASFGLAGWRPGESVTDLIARADACLYDAKRNGRDRICADADAGCDQAA